MSFQKEIDIRLQDPRIFLNEFFGYLSFVAGLVTAICVVLKLGFHSQANWVLMTSAALQNLPLFMVYTPQYRMLLSLGMLGIIVTNPLAVQPVFNAFREGLFVGMIKVDYSYEALVKYQPEKYPYEAVTFGRRSDNADSSKLTDDLQNSKPGIVSCLVGLVRSLWRTVEIILSFIFRLFAEEGLMAKFTNYLGTIINETFIRSKEMLAEIFIKANFKAFVNDPIRSQFFSSLMRIISATPLFVIAAIEVLSYFGYFEKTEAYNASAAIWTTISVRALAFSSFIDGLSKIAFGVMRDSFMMKVGGLIFAFAQLYLMIRGEHHLDLVIPLSLAGLAAYPIAEGERLRRLALED